MENKKNWVSLCMDSVCGNSRHELRVFYCVQHLQPIRCKGS